MWGVAGKLQIRAYRRLSSSFGLENYSNCLYFHFSHRVNIYVNVIDIILDEFNCPVLCVKQTIILSYHLH